MKNKYFMAAEDGDALEIVIYGDIVSQTFFESDVSADSIVKTLNQSKAKDITVKINSYGGDVGEAIAIYNELRSKSKSGAKVTTIDMGFACSSASVIFCAGDTRVMAKSSMLMIHNPWMFISGNAKEMKKAAADLEKVTKSILDIYQDVINITADELQALMDAESWIETQDAIDMGFATEMEENTDNSSQAAARVRKSLFAKFKAEEKKPEDPEEPEPDDPEEPEEPEPDQEPEDPTEPEPEPEKPEPEKPEDPDDPEDPEKKEQTTDLFKSFRKKRRK